MLATLPSTTADRTSKIARLKDWSGFMGNFLVVSVQSQWESEVICSEVGILWQDQNPSAAALPAPPRPSRRRRQAISPLRMAICKLRRINSRSPQEDQHHETGR